MEKKNNWKGWLYLAPVLILMLVFTFYPLINTFLASFREVYSIDANGGYNEQGWTFDNYGKVLGIIPTGEGSASTDWGDVATIDTEFLRHSLKNTLLLTFITVPASIFIALLIAVGLNSIKPLKKFLQTVFFMPYVTNAIAVGMVFSVIFAQEHGLWNEIFRLGNTGWVDGDYTHAMIVLCIFIIWNALPYKILILLSGLQNIDKQYYQAAQIDAAGKIKTFWRITVPLLSPQILYIMITSFIGAFKEYNSVVALFDSKYLDLHYQDGAVLSTVVFYIYDKIGNNTQLACAGAVILFLIIMLFTAIQFMISKKKVHY